MATLISDEGKIGIGLALLFGVGTGAAVMFPDQRWIGAGIMYISVVGLGILGLHHFQIGRKRVIPAIGMIVFGVAFLGCGIWYLWSPSAASDARKPLDEFASLSNTQLRNKVSAFASDLRALDSKYRRREEALRLERGLLIRDGQSFYDQRKIAAETDSLVTTISEEKTLEIRDKFLPDARALRESINNRIGAELDYLNIHTDEAAEFRLAQIMLSTGLPTGYGAANVIADFLQYRARQLP